MTSLMCTPRDGGQVIVHSHELFDELLQHQIQNREIPDHHVKNSTALSARRRRVQHKRPQSSPCVSQYQKTSKSKPAKLPLSRAMTWVHENSITQNMDYSTRNTYDTYNRLLDKDSVVSMEVDDLLSNNTLNTQRRKEILHKRWTDQVYEPISTKLFNEVYSHDYDQLAMKKRDIYKQYLEFYNKKGHVFLDTVSPDEYCPRPFQPQYNPLFRDTAHNVSDPLLVEERERANEDRILYQCENGSRLSNEELQQLRLPTLPLVPLGRHGTECSTWANMPAHNIESPVRLASRRRMRSYQNHSQITFDRPSHHSVCSSFLHEGSSHHSRSQRPLTSGNSNHSSENILYRGVNVQSIGIQVGDHTQEE